jgi:uncharacterized protein YcgI (DUF1989 family)
MEMPGIVRSVTLHQERAETIPPQSGTSLTLWAGEILQITDLEGQQVSDIVAFSAADTAEAICSGRTLDYNGTIRLTTGHVLYSNRGNPIFTIVADDVGVHDFMLAPCSPEMFGLLHGMTGYHPSCFENISQSLAPYEIPRDSIPTAFNAFMHVQVSSDGTLTVVPPVSRAGDSVHLRAEMDLLVAITACSAEQSNNGAFKPIGVRVLRAE